MVVLDVLRHFYFNVLYVMHNKAHDFKVRWPSGLRRQTKEEWDSNPLFHLVLRGVGSNPTLISFCFCYFVAQEETGKRARRGESKVESLTRPTSHLVTSRTVTWHIHVYASR
jgi:hypothetical protein